MVRSVTGYGTMEPPQSPSQPSTQGVSAEIIHTVATQLLQQQAPPSTQQQTLSLKLGSYVGEAQNGVPHGKGKLTYAPGLLKSFEGEWKEGKAYGTGVLIGSDGTTLEGTWDNDFLHGQGSSSFPNGDKYKGAFFNGLQHGTGTMTYADGSTYTGDWINNKRHGRGKYTKPDGSWYSGEWKNDKREGQGESSSPDGRSYSGGWKNDYRNGQGELRGPSGVVKGVFHNDLFWNGSLNTEWGVVKYKNGETDCCSIL